MERRIPNDELLAEAKRLIAEIEGQNPHLKTSIDLQSKEHLLAQIEVWKREVEQLRAELKAVREDKRVFAKRVDRLEERLRRRREITAERQERADFDPYPSRPVEPRPDILPDWSNDPATLRDLHQGGATERWIFDPGSAPTELRQDHWLTRFTDHPITRFTAFALMSGGLGIYMFLKGGL